MLLKNTIRVYSELVHSKELCSHISGKKTNVCIKTNLTGDVLVFLNPKINCSLREQLNYLGSDENLVSQMAIAQHDLQDKINIVLSIPKAISMILVLVVLLSVFYSTGTEIYYIISTEEISIVCLVIKLFPSLTALLYPYRKKVSFTITSFFLKLFFRRV